MTPNRIEPHAQAIRDELAAVKAALANIEIVKMFEPRPGQGRGKSALERFERQYMPEPNSGCWLWVGFVNHYGYGEFRVSGKLTMAHRFSYEHFVKPIPKGLTIDHLCRVRCCVNPSHLEPVTNRENILRGVSPSAINARKTQCSRGHPFAGSNLALRSGFRVCKTCKKITRPENVQRVYDARPAGLDPERHN